MDVKLVKRISLCLAICIALGVVLTLSGVPRDLSIPLPILLFLLILGSYLEKNYSVPRSVAYASLAVLCAVGVYIPRHNVALAAVVLVIGLGSTLRILLVQKWANRKK